MKLNAGYPYSLIKYGLPYEYTKLEKDIKTDVLILGGGISGALAAWYLIKNDIDCIVVDKRTIGLGSTCASTTLLQYEIDVPLFKLIKEKGAQNAVRAYTKCSEAIDKLKSIANEMEFTFFEKKKSLYFAEKQSHRDNLLNEYKARAQYGFEVEWLEADDIQKQFNFRSPCAILSQQGAQANAYMFTHSLLQYGIQKGLKVFDRTNITSVNPGKEDVKVKTENGFTITCRNIIHATGYEVTEYLKKDIVKFHSTFAVVSESNTLSQANLSDIILWNTANPYLYMRTTADKRIMIGGRDEKGYNITRAETIIDKKSKLLVRDFEKLFPGTPFNHEFSWTGTYGTTNDGLPYIGEYKRMPRSYFALGFGGNGITFSQVAAEIICDLLKGRKNSDVELFSFDRK